MAAPDRNIALEMVRATEAAAMAAGRWMGRGDKNGVDGAAVNAMRFMLNNVNMDGRVVIGEGEKDEAPMLFNGEKLGTGCDPQVDIAVDPIDGTRLTAQGLPNAVSVVAFAERGTMFDPQHIFYMDKIAQVLMRHGVNTRHLLGQHKGGSKGAENRSKTSQSSFLTDRDMRANQRDRSMHARIRLIRTESAGALSTCKPNSVSTSSWYRRFPSGNNGIASVRRNNISAQALPRKREREGARKGMDVNSPHLNACRRTCSCS